MKTRIAGIDPGGTTGVCCIEIDELSGSRVLESYQVPDIWKAKIGFGHCDVMVVESMVPHGKLTQGKIDQIKSIAIIESQSRFRGQDFIKWVTPEERGRVKKAPSCVVGTHAKDAFRVALAYALREGLISPDEAVTLSNEGQTG